MNECRFQEHNFENSHILAHRATYIYIIIITKDSGATQQMSVAMVTTMAGK
jgi:hypothetical protein